MEKIKRSHTSPRGNLELKKHRSRTLAAIAAAAALLVALAGTAFAFNVYRVADYFRSYFGGLSEQQAEVLESIGVSEPSDAASDKEASSKVGLQPVTSNGTTMTPLAAFADEYFLYLALKIEAPEGVVLNPNTQGTLPGSDGGFYQIFNPDSPETLSYYVVFDESSYESAGFSSSLTWLDEHPGDNEISLIISLTAQADGDLKWNDGIPKTIRIQGIWNQTPEKEYTQILSGLWEFELEKFGVIEPISLGVDGLETYFYFEKVDGIVYKEEREEGLQVSDEYKMTLDYMTVSPLSISYAYTCVYSEDTYPGPGVFCAVMKDGSRVEISYAGGSWGRGADGETAYVTGLGEFSEPVVLENIDYIRFGGLEIPVVAN